MAQLTYNSNRGAALVSQHIATNLDNYEAARSNFFVLEVFGMNNLMKTNYRNGINNATNNDLMNTTRVEDTIKLNVTKFPVPGFKVNTQAYKRGNDTVNFAAGGEFNNTGTMVVDDIIGVDTKSIMLAWKRLAYDENTFKGGRMKDYKKTARLYEYTQDFELIRTWTIYGLFVTEVGEADFDKEGSEDKRQLNVGIIFDRAVNELPEAKAEKE